MQAFQRDPVMAHVSVDPQNQERPWLPIRVFQFPGNVVADLIGATDGEDRMALRVLIDMLFWNLAVVIVAILAVTEFG